MGYIDFFFLFLEETGVTDPDFKWILALLSLGFR
jgi:hypothetical protein